MRKTITISAAVLGVIFVVLAIVYWTTPANALPTFFPGYDPSLASVHLKHGFAALILGLAAFVFVWFRSGKKRSSQ
jgi:hypothetical protein